MRNRQNIVQDTWCIVSPQPTSNNKILWNLINKSMRHFQSSQFRNQITIQTFYFPMPWWRKSSSGRCGLLQKSLWSLWSLRSLRAYLVHRNGTVFHMISSKVPRNSIKVNFIHVWFSVRQHKNVNKMALKGVKEMKNEKLWRWKKHVLFHCMGGNQLLSGFFEWCKASDFMHWFQLTSAAPSIFSRNGWKRKATNVWPTSAQCLWHRQGCFAACVFMQYNGMLLEPISLDQGTNENDINCTNGK